MSIVLDLQKEAMLHSGSVLTLLRTAFVVARKLETTKVADWARLEIEGYKADVPDYRKFSSILKAWHPINGWQSPQYQGDDIDRLEETEKAITEVWIDNPIVEIESWLTSSSTGVGHVDSQLSVGEMKRFQINSSCVVRRLPISALTRIPERIRSYILDWSLELEENGILGNEMTFTKQEKAPGTQCNDK